MTSTQAIIAEHPNLFKIDDRLNKLVKKIELLNYVNPINIEQEKRTFFANRYNSAPNFKYKRIDFDAHKLQQQLFSQEQARHFVDSMHAVASADGEVSPEELREIQAVAKELGFPVNP